MALNNLEQKPSVPADGPADPRHVGGNRHFKRRVSGYALLAGLAFTALNAGAASAQENQPASPSAGEKKQQVEEIVVSARRKDEKLSDVPISVSVLSSDYMEKQNIQNFTDYATRIPNLSFQYGQGSDVTSVGFSGGRQTMIRGIAGANTTAYYINDTPVPETVSPQALGLDRIEVLKGPQGTLFGASSMGGNVRFVTKEPSLTSEDSTVQVQAGGTADGGGPDGGGSAMTNVVVVPDKIAFNVAIGDEHDSGFINRTFPDSAGNLVTRGGQGADDDLQGMATLRFKVTDQLEASFTAMGEYHSLHGFPAAYVPLPAYVPTSYTLSRWRDVQEYSRDRWGLGSFVLKYNGAGYAVVSSTSYFNREVQELEDDTEGTNQFYELFNQPPINLGDPALYVIDAIHEKRLTQESRISFDEGTIIPHLSGVAGVFYQKKDVTFYQPAIAVPALTAAGFPQNYQNEVNIPEHEQDIAAFGELYYEVLPRLTLTFGAREYWITQVDDANLATGAVNDPNPAAGPINPATGVYAPEVRNFQRGLVPKGVVSYKIDDDALVYGSVSEGFRPGGVVPPLPSFCAQDLAAIGVSEARAEHFKPDSLWSYEIGAKDRLADGRIDVSASAFEIDWSQLQQSIVLPTCTFSFTANAGKAQLRGGELEVSGRPLDHVPLTIQVGLGYTNAILQDPGLIPQAPNSQLNLVPEFTGTISEYYVTPLTDSIDLFIGSDYSYTGSVQVPNIGGSGTLTRQPFNMVNANIGVDFGSSQLSIYGKNLLDEHLNFGDLYPSGFVRKQLLPDGTYQRLPVAAVSRPLQLGVQYKVFF